MTAFVPGIMGAGTLPRWALLTLALVPIVWAWPILVTLAHIVGGAFVLLAAASLAWSVQWHDTIGGLLVLMILAGTFMAGSLNHGLTTFYAGAAIGIGVSSLIVVIEAAGWKMVPGLPSGGLFVNPLFLAEAAVLVTVAGVASGQLWVAWLTGPAIIMPLLAQTGRGAFVALCGCARGAARHCNVGLGLFPACRRHPQI